MSRNINELIGKTLKSVTVSEDKSEMIFTVDDGSAYKMYHDQECCESVEVEDICGELEDLVGSQILKAECSSSEGEGEAGEDIKEYWEGTYTWTYYKLATLKGYVDIRWYGSSNGCYSEKVDFIKMGEDVEY